MVPIPNLGPGPDLGMTRSLAAAEGAATTAEEGLPGISEVGLRSTQEQPRVQVGAWRSHYFLSFIFKIPS